MQKIIGLLLLFVPVSGYTQKNETNQDTVFFKNGTIVRGIITDESDKKIIRIRYINKQGIDSTYMYTKENVIQIKRRNKEQIAVPDMSNYNRQPESGIPTKPTYPRMEHAMTEQSSDFRLANPMKQTMKFHPTPHKVKKEAPILIEKNTPSFSPGQNAGTKVDDFDPYAYIPPRKARIDWYRQIRGFRMFIDQGVTLGIGNEKNNQYNFTGSAGFQFNPIFYIGAGLGYNLSLNKKESSMPLFINPRINFLDDDTTPFLDLRAGYSFLEGKGVYLSPMVGISLGKGKQAFNIGIGYSFQRAKFKERDPNTVIPRSVFQNYQGLSLRLTYER